MPALVRASDPGYRTSALARTSNRSRRASPTKLAPSTVSVMIMPAESGTPHRPVHEAVPLAQHRAPARRGRLDAESQETEVCLGQNRRADRHRELHDQRADRVRQDVAQRDPQVTRAEATCSLDELPLADGEHLRA